MYTLSDIFIYPIKSLGKVSLKQSFAEIKGFQFDRRMMLTDDRGNFLSQRKYPEMSRFRVSINKDGFLVQHDGEELLIPLKMKTIQSRQVTIWNDQVTVSEADINFSLWFSNQLNTKCHLVIMNEKTLRLVDEEYTIHNETVSFSDGFPYLVIGSASLQDLNNKLKNPIPMDRFRPNLVISTEKPFIEDEFDIFKIGNAVFKRSKPCARCIITTTDQFTGERGNEPLLTLSKYRKVDNKVYFGQNLICLKEGSVKTGDSIDLETDLS